MLSEQREVLGDGFMSGTIDFWTDSHRRECFGAFVLDMLSNKYELEDGTTLFMSNETRKKVDSSKFKTGKIFFG